MNIPTKHLCEIRLGELTDLDIADLVEFAEWRLVTLGLPASLGKDLTQMGLEVIIQGMETGQGRRPRPEDVSDKQAFLNYVRGVIASKSEAQGRKPEFRCPHEPPDEELPNGALASPELVAQVNDLQQQLFPLLKERSPVRLQATIAAWEQVFTYADRIPSVRNQRKYIREVREISQAVLSEIGGLEDWR
jgi:hypothetical protein